MPLPYRLWGDEARTRFIEEYNVQCLSHTLLLPGREKSCACGRENIASNFFTFSFFPKNSPDNTTPELFYSGPYCGRKLCSLLKIKPPLMVELFTREGNERSSSKISEKSGHHDEDYMLPVNKEFFVAATLLFAFLDDFQDVLLQKYVDGVCKYPKHEIFPYKIERLNTEISKHDEITRHGTLRQAIAELIRNANRTPREYEFLNLERILNAAGKKLFI